MPPLLAARFPVPTRNPDQPDNVTPKRITRDKPRIGASEVTIGVPYKFGGNDRERGVDCSGLTQCVYRENGIKIPRTAITQWRDRRFGEVRGPLMEGDLVFFDTGRNRRRDNKIDGGRWVTHVGIVDANGNIVHASSSRGVTVESLDAFLKRSRARYLGAKRISE